MPVPHPSLSTFRQHYDDGVFSHYPAGMSGRRLLRYFFLVGLAYVVATLGAGLTDYLTRYDLSANTNLAISGGVGLLTALLLGAIDLAKPAPTYPSGTYPSGTYPSGTYPPLAHPGYAAPPVRKSPGGVGLVLVGVLLLALCGGAGYGLTNGVTWAAGKLSDIATPPWLQKTRDPGVERLASKTTTENGTLSVTVRSVRVNDEVTMVELGMTNRGGSALTLPLLENAQLSMPGKTFKADPSASDPTWPGSIPPGEETIGTAVFDGVLPRGPVDVSLSFSHIFGTGLDSPRSITIRFSVT
jgi:hypothetical protein